MLTDLPERRTVMPKCVLLAVLVMLGAVPPPGAMAQRQAQIAFADPQPHFVAAWAPKQERAAERVAVLARRVSLELTDVSLDAALKALTRQARLLITYSPAMLPRDKRVTISASDVAVVTALTEMLFRSGLDVVVDRDGTLAVVPCVHAAREVQVQDTGAIVGRVTDKATGAPIVGATVVVEGTGKSASTDNEGRYRITGLGRGAYPLHARYIGYSPATVTLVVEEGQDATANFALDRSVQQLDQVVVTGTVAPTEQRALPAPISVVSRAQIQEQNLVRVDQIFRGTVPGSFAWDLGTQGFFSAIALRGTSSLQNNTVKTFIDGIEVADPTYLATIDPNSIDRVEVTRGPQASIVYGADANGGVMQVFTRRGRIGATQPQVSVKASVGAIDALERSKLAVRHDYSATVQGGGQGFSYTLGGSYLRDGEWVRDYYSTDGGGNGAVTVVQGPATLEVSARYAAKTFVPVWPPALRDSGYAFFVAPTNDEVRLRQQTYGARFTFLALPRWYQRATIGYDRTYSEDVNTAPRFTSPEDSLLKVAWGDASKTSLAYNTWLELPLTRSISSTFLAGADHYSFAGTAFFTSTASRSSGSIDGQSAFVTRTPFTNTGVFSQLQMGVWESVFVTAGLRADWNDNFGDGFGAAWSPRVGFSVVRNFTGVTMKLRGSYGNAIRAPLPDQKTASLRPFVTQRENPALGPERQIGGDGGIELYFGPKGSLAATYFTQKARDLIAFVLIEPGDFAASPPRPPVYQYQNVASVKNTGWEFEGHLDLGRVRVLGTYSIMNSRVGDLGPNYTGDYRVGDRVRGVPRTSAGGSIVVTPLSGTTIAGTITYAGSWTDYDQAAFYATFFAGQPYRGTNRAYWMTYPSFTKLGLGVTQVLTPWLTGFVRADNLGNNRAFERDNGSTPLGRVTTVGLKATH
jgi:outer membrane receptor protein involved in Fe transport